MVGIRLGLVTNPLARLNRRHSVIAGAAAARQDVQVAVFRGGSDLAGQVRRMVASGVTDLVVDGGDGTVAATASALLRLDDGGPLPRLILVPSGTTNLVAGILGDRGPRQTLFSRLDAMPPEMLDQHTLVLPPMQIDRGIGQPLLHGFLAGLGAFHAATLIAQRRIRQFDLRNRAAVAFGVAAGVWRSFRGPERQSLLAGEPIAMTVDRESEPGGRRMLLLVSSLDRLCMGLRPFWGAQAQSLHWLSVAERPRALLRALPRVLAGRPAGWMEAAGYRSGGASRLEIRTDRPFVLDGEIVEAGPQGAFSIEPARPLRFLRLPR